MPDTARRYGLRVDDTVDERRDAEKSTDAALSYLSTLYNRFGSWYLAAAAYNTGENRVGRIMTDTTGSERGTDADYYRIWDQLPGETRDFVPATVALARIGREAGRYGFGERLPVPGSDGGAASALPGSGYRQPGTGNLSAPRPPRPRLTVRCRSNSLRGVCDDRH